MEIYIFFTGYATFILKLDTVSFNRAWNEKMVASRHTIKRLQGKMDQKAP